MLFRSIALGSSINVIKQGKIWLLSGNAKWKFFSTSEADTSQGWNLILVNKNYIKDYYSQLLGLSGDDSYEERCKLHTVCGHDGGILHSGDGRISVVTYHGEFNYSAVNNLGVSYATGEYILLLNNDTEVITANWMEEMLMYAQREDVGAVGAKLYYADKTILI